MTVTESELDQTKAINVAQVISNDFAGDCCYKINTGAPVPIFADCVIQVEDTKIVELDSGVERIIDIIVDPSMDLDIRYVVHNSTN